MTRVPIALCWIRRDLRLSDHAALARATEIADRVIVVFVFDRVILDALEDRDDRRVNFIHQSLVELNENLERHGSKLLVRVGDPTQEIPEVARDLDAKVVVTARDYEPYARERDATVERKLEASGIEFETVKDTVVKEGGEVFSQSGTPLKVYTPYARAWRAAFSSSTDAADHEADLTRLANADAFESLCHPWTMDELGFIENTLWLASGETAAKERLAAFRSRIDDYGTSRDFPALEATSGLSVHLRFGTISIRECVRVALERQTPGADKWLAELIWRDFYQDVLWHNPQVVRTTFQSQYAEMVWPGTAAHYDAWEKGMTGYPIVDAAMRCFNATGWMHNRLRMIVASFLTKDLLVDYRRGEEYFARKLLDFDLASNNGGWQWAASVGVDAQPYFRIFNPVLQSLKFDPEGSFIRQWIPEIAALEGDALHKPYEAGVFALIQAGVILGETYPAPIVEHHVQKDLAVKLLEGYKSRAREGE